MTRIPDYTDCRYVGKVGKMYVVTDGICTRYLNNREFCRFVQQLFGFAH